MFDFLKGKKEEKKLFLSDEDKRELAELERKSYMDEARKLIPERAKVRAKHDYGTKKPEDEY